MFTLLTGKPPFETKNIKETYRRIKKIKYEFPPDSDQYISSQAKNLISSIFTKDPTKRPNLFQIKNNPFFTELPIPKAMPPSILKRAPTNNELFGMDHPEEVLNGNRNKNNSNSRPPLISRGYQQNTNHLNSNYTKNGNQIGHNEEKENKLLQPQSIEPVNTLNAKRKENSFLSVIKHIDYSQKYGMGYILSNGCTGIYFNDSTKILLHRNRENVIYVDHEENEQQCSLSNFPTCLKKKITLLKHFTDYLWRKDDKTDNVTNDKINKLKIRAHINEHDDFQAKEYQIYVKTTLSDQYCTLFKLSNNTVQVNFTDSSQIILQDTFVRYHDKNGDDNVYKLKDLFTSKKDLRKDLKKRCKYTQQLLHKVNR